MGSVERAGDATSEVESGEDDEVLNSGEIPEHILKGYLIIISIT